MTWRQPVLLMMLLLGCTHERSERVADLITAYAPGLEVGQSVTDARQVLPALAFPNGGPFYHAKLRHPVDGLTDVFLLDNRPDWERPPSEQAKIEEIEFAGQDPKSAALIEKRLGDLFGVVRREGCYGNASGKAHDAVLLWVDGSKGGAVLTVPYERVGLDSLTTTEVRLTVFAGEWKPERFTSDFLGYENCKRWSALR